MCGGAGVCVSQADEEIDWQLLKPDIFGTIMDFFTSGAPVITGEPPPADTGLRLS